MNQESSRYISTFPADDERPSKRSRVENSTNGLGIDIVSRRISCSSSADPYVSRHAGKLDVQFPAEFALEEPRNSDLTILTSLHTSDFPTPDRRDLGQSIEADKEEKQVPTSRLSALFTRQYNRQTQEYDEGMYVYNQSLVVDRQASESMRSASLLYNVGLTHVCQGKYKDAQRWFELALVRVTQESARAEAALVMVCIHHNLGHCHYRLGCNSEALRSYQKAITLTQEHQIGALHVAASLNCIGVLHFHSDLVFKDSQKILAIFQQCLVVYRQWKGPNSSEAATILNNIGRVHYLETKYDEALHAYNEALEIRRFLLGSTSIDVAVTICNKGQTHHQREEYDEAMKCYQDFLEFAQARLGPTHRDIPVIYKCMAEIHHEKGDIENARTMYEKALQAGRRATGNFHPEIASTINKLASIYYEMQDLDTALKYYTEGLKVEQAVLEECHPRIIVTLLNIAQIERHRGNSGAALTKYREAHALQVKSKGPNSIEVASSLSNMAMMHYQLKSYSAAFDLYQKALLIQREHYGSDENLEVASTLNAIGLVLCSKGIYRLAKSCFTDSLRVRKSILGPDHHDVAILWYNIATIHQEMGNDDQAIMLYKETLRVERAALGEKHHDVIPTLQQLGLAYQQSGNLEQSLQYFSEALDIERSNGKSQIALAKLLNLVGNIHLQQGNIPQMMECYSEACRIYQNSSQHNETLVIAGYNFYGMSKIHPPGASMA